MKTLRSLSTQPLLWFGAAALLAGGLKLWLVAAGRVPFNSDEAVVALMARHILNGARPIFFYGQAYMGSLDAGLVAGGFALLGAHVWVIRLVQALLYLGVLGTTAWLGRRAFEARETGRLAMLLLAIPAVNTTLYTTASLGGYGEALLLGNLSLLVAIRLGRAAQPGSTSGPMGLWVLLGLLTGLGVWAFGLALVFSLPALAYLAFKLAAAARLEHRTAAGLDRRTASVTFLRRAALPALLLVAGGLLGAAPWWRYALEHGFGGLLGELGGGAIAEVEPMPWIFRVGRHLVGMLLLGIPALLGFRPPWDVIWLGLPLLPFVLFFWLAVSVQIVRRLRSSHPHRAEQAMLVGVMLTLLVVFVVSPFGADPSGRYFLPLVIPLALFAADLIQSWRGRWGTWAYGAAVLLLVFHLVGTVQSARRFPPGITTQFYAPAQVDHRPMGDLIAFLTAQGETRGYTNYWITYPLAFLSDETLIFTPRLPYHRDFRYTRRDDRYPPYAAQVAAAERTAYITTHHPDLDAYLRQHFTALGVTWQEHTLGDYHIFYALSRPVHPEEIGLGTTTSATGGRP